MIRFLIRLWLAFGIRVTSSLALLFFLAGKRLLSIGITARFNTIGLSRESSVEIHYPFGW